MLDIAKKAILNSRLFIFLAFFVFFKPLSFYYYDFLNKICNILMLVLIGIIDILYIKQCIKNKKISKIQIYIIESKNKNKIIKELDKLSISKAVLFPEIEEVVEYIKKKY